MSDELVTKILSGTPKGLARQINSLGTEFAFFFGSSGGAPIVFTNNGARAHTLALIGTNEFSSPWPRKATVHTGRIEDLGELIDSLAGNGAGNG